ncbi:histidine--tRNA ligase [candidate division WOR-1 bacterium RIFOXYB2_FULL_42_35]|uniref:Histidine--tRNA ligase n=1 Tax=candidate division WOR-1 bacterium RIFOXYC2_FULL_41_25 TaxID=1802586 RepID=A0A1F4TJ47_UNCSA|nr:MAG: histidine--tRNA ligase [candidate division WOR-1 bacterium RIFOXYA2_FULL_41_14]OGC21897.1 MAG: histidine--tRNA ligase [candidate division WOR-1 bacterium RIFOXYB2_FULL_42_35]OGC32761.1 MAG: histidine--tRNA ligase [candidate division WOR-1 bacterium RIFOXYC2_FULL_41_25]
MAYSAPRGTKDILPQEVALWQKLEETCRKVFSFYNYQEIRTPIFESTELFARSIGKTTDIVNKEMYEFKDRKGRSLTLRPEETAPVVRACLENNLIGTDKTTKVYYIGPMFRYERPQAGRQRQFHQAGVEVFGSADPMIDAEVIMMNVRLFEELGLKDLGVNINSVGCAKCRPDYLKKLKSFFKDNIKNMCEDCQNRFITNPLRILDCKQSKCQIYLDDAPHSVESLCQECGGSFDQVLDLLGDSGLKYNVNKRLVRGLDYYTKTTFEITSNQLGAQNAVSGGGRYDKLVEELGGKAIPAVGFAIGLERIIELINNQQLTINNDGAVKLYIAALGNEARKVGFDLINQARAGGISADMDYLGKSLKAQMKTADRVGAKYVYIIGEAELAKKSAVLKEMKTGEQIELEFSALLEKLKSETA